MRLRTQGQERDAGPPDIARATGLGDSARSPPGCARRSRPAGPRDTNESEGSVTAFMAVAAAVAATVAARSLPWSRWLCHGLDSVSDGSLRLSPPSERGPPCRMQAWPPAPLRGRPRGHGTRPSESLTGAATPLCPLSPSCHPPDSCHPSHPLYNDASHQTIRVELHVSWRETGWCERTPQVHSKSACSDGSPRPSGPPLWVLASRFADLVGLFGPPLDWPLYYGRHYQPLAVFCPQKPLCCFLLSAVFCSCSRIWDPY